MILVSNDDVGFSPSCCCHAHICLLTQCHLVVNMDDEKDDTANGMNRAVQTNGSHRMVIVVLVVVVRRTLDLDGMTTECIPSYGDNGDGYRDGIRLYMH